MVDIEERIKWIVEDLKTYDPEKIILFGSAARGDIDSYSDLDFAVIKKTDKRFLQRLAEVVEFLRPNLGSVDILVYTPEEFEKMKEAENPFIEQVLKDGKVIYEKR